MTIDIQQFFGENPRTNPKVLEDGYAVVAQNCDLDRGMLEPIMGVSSVSDLTAGIQTIYKMGSSFLTWDNIVNVVKSLVANSGDRIFYSGDGYPKDTNEDLAIDGDGPYPDATRRLGIPAPTNALTVTLVGTAGEDITRSVSYVYTIVAKWEDGSDVESAPSAPTGVFDVYDGITARLTGFEDSTADGVYTTHFRIYRLNTGTDGTEYQYVTEVADTTTTWDDTVDDDDLAEVLPTQDWTTPDEDLSGLTATSHGLVYGFKDNTIYPSEVFIPYAYPYGYSMNTESDIVGLGYTGSMVVILTETVPYLVDGQDPETLALTRLNYQQPCISARSIAGFPGGVIYACPDGLYGIDESGQGSVMTSTVMTRSQWNAMGPENLIGVFYDDAYYGFFSGTTNAFFLDLNTGEYRVFSLPEKVYGAHYCPEDDILYLIIEKSSIREIVSWRTGSLMDMTWKSKEYVGYGWISAGMVQGDFTNGNATFKLYVDGTLSFTKTVSNDDVFSIPPTPGEIFQIEVSGKATISRIIAGQSFEDVIGALANV